MDSLTIDTGVKRLCINGDPDRVISFNPVDVAFAEHFYQLVIDLQEKQAEFRERGDALDANKEVDENGIPVNVKDALSLLRDFCEFFNQQIDNVFGEGTAKAAFDGALDYDMYFQFIDGVLPYVQSARGERMSKYAPASKKSRVMK